MNVRTNTRSWRKYACYIVEVGIRGENGRAYIYGELRAIAIDRMSKVILLNELGKYQAGSELYMIDTERTAQKAIEKAIEYYKKSIGR